MTTDSNPSNRVDVWRDRYRVHSYEVDSQGNATPAVLCNYMQESAWRHAERLGLGFATLSEKNLIWVLARQRVIIEAFPKWGDTITLHTWPTGHDRVLCYRDFQILNAANAVIGKATSAWLVIDIHTRRPQRAQSYFHLQIPADVEQVFMDKLGKLAPLTAVDFTNAIRVGYQDLDVNGHVNNTRYIDWILAGLSFAFLSTHTVQELEIHYLSEALYDDELRIEHQQQTDLTLCHRLMRQQDEICRAKTRWRVGSASAVCLAP